MKPKKTLNADKYLRGKGINIAEYKEQRKAAQKRLQELNNRIQAVRDAQGEMI